MSYQFYPTGVRTAAKMWAKFKRPVIDVCDPSAGKGHLFMHAEKGFPGMSDEELPWMKASEGNQIGGERNRAQLRNARRLRFADPRSKLAVEIDGQHHAVLREMGCKILGFDFLQVQSLATCSQVIMNPPFQHGAEHVLHAWDAIYDCELVAIINADSIRNPFSQDRRRLCALIEEHGSVEFFQDEFADDVERRTKVEIALIYLEKVPSQYLDMDSLLGKMKTDAAPAGVLEPEISHALSLPDNFVQDTCYRFQRAVDSIRKACNAQAVAEKLVSEIGVTLADMQAKGVGNDFREATMNIRSNANKAFQERYENAKERAWGQIIRSTLLTNALSNQACRKIEAKASSIYEMEFSEANVLGFLRWTIESMGDIYRDMVCDLFDTIIERSSDNVVFYKSWKSNAKHKVGVRIRRTRFIIPRFSVSEWSGSLDYRSKQFLADIDKVFGYLHDVQGPYDGLVNGFEVNDVRGADRISTRFFDFRYYMGAKTIHFYPKSEAVVEKLNQFVGRLRQWIPGDMAQANADFSKQYERGESLTKEYLERYGKLHRDSLTRASPSTSLVRLIKDEGDADDEQTLERLHTAIGDAHMSHGLNPGPALSHATPSAKAIGYAKTGEHSAQEHQLLLLCD